MIGKAVAASFDIAPSTAGKWSRAFSRSGPVGPARIGGHLRSAPEPYGAWIREQVRARPGITVRELARRVNALLGLAVGRDTVWRFLKRCGPVFKKMTRVADERERPDVKRRRERWVRHQGRIGPERLVFLDETCVKTNMARLRGWGPKGERLPGPAPFGHWNTSTLIAALRHDRIDAPWVFDGPVNGEVFLTWVTRELVSTLRAGDLVVMDNLACHKGPDVLRAIRAAGAHVLFLPPYSPDLNPIEQTFAKIKHRLRNAAARSRETLWRAVGEVLEDIGPLECANHLRNAGYGSNWAGHALGVAESWARVSALNRDLHARRPDRTAGSAFQQGSAADQQGQVQKAVRSPYGHAWKAQACINHGERLGHDGERHQGPGAFARHSDLVDMAVSMVN